MKNVLEVTTTHRGGFYKAKLNGERITREELFTLIGIERLSGYRLEKYLYEFRDSTSNYEVDVSEIDIS